MPTERRFHLLQFLIAIGLAFALMGAAQYVPFFDEYPAAYFWAGLFAAVIFFGLAVKAALREDPHAPRIGRRRGMLSLVGMLASGVGLIGSAAWYFWPYPGTVAPNREAALPGQPKGSEPAQASHSSDIADEKLPGIAVAAAIRIRDAGAFRGKYLFSFQDPEGAKATFHLSSDDIFKFSMKPVNGDFQVLDVPFGNSRIPIDTTIYLTCEVGTAGDYSFMRVTVDGNVVAERKFQFRIEPGSRNWTETHLATDEDAQHAGAFDLLELGKWPATFTRAETKALVENARAYYNTRRPEH